MSFSRALRGYALELRGWTGMRVEAVERLERLEVL